MKSKRNIIIVAIMVIVAVAITIFNIYNFSHRPIGGSTTADLTSDMTALLGDTYDGKTIDTYTYDDGTEIVVKESLVFSISRSGYQKWHDTMPTADHDGHAFGTSDKIDIYDCQAVMMRSVWIDGVQVADTVSSQTITYKGYEDGGSDNDARAVVDEASKVVAYSDNQAVFEDTKTMADTAYQNKNK